MGLFIFLSLHVTLAWVATMHVLLSKENVRSAIGWIGLIWLSPGLGACLYYAFGINRVARRAIKRVERGQRQLELPDSRNNCMPVSLNRQMTKLCEVGQRLTGETLFPGNQLKLLQNGDAAYPAMLAEISTAKRFICLATYILRSDAVGEQFADALITAHRRGVEIRVLIDAIGSGFFVSRVVRRLKAEGLYVARFLFDWRPWRVSFLNLRNHKKLLLIDGKQGFVGGLNLGSENTINFVAARRVYDIHFGIDGPVVAQLMQNFARDWEFATDERLDADMWWPQIDPCGESDCRVLTSGPDEDVGKIESVFAVALGVARRHVRIVTPYFLPDEKLGEALRLAALRGVRVDVILPEKSDHALVDWAMRGHLLFFLDHGLYCHLSTTSFDHAKLVTVDGEWCAFGSPNWDVRSLRLNFELLVECYTRETVAVIDGIITDRLSKSKPLFVDELSAQRLSIKLRNAAARLFLPYL